MTTQELSAPESATRSFGPATADVSHRLSKLYPCLLNWAFAVFSSTRILTYLPTLWAIYTSGDSSQHSLLTWLAWVGSNATMAAWLYENNDRRCNKAIVVTMGNSAMCFAACILIVAYR